MLLLAALALSRQAAAATTSDGSASGDDAAVVETEATDDEPTTWPRTTTGRRDDDVASRASARSFAGLSARSSRARWPARTASTPPSEVFDEIADQVPEEIRDDYQVLADNFQELADALKGIDLASGETPSPEALAKLQELSASLDTPEVQQATENIEAWARENC